MAVRSVVGDGMMGRSQKKGLFDETLVIPGMGGPEVHVASSSRSSFSSLYRGTCRLLFAFSLRPLCTPLPSYLLKRVPSHRVTKQPQLPQCMHEDRAKEFLCTSIEMACH